MNKPNQFPSQLDMFKPVQVGMDLRSPDQRAQEPTSVTYIIELTAIEKFCLQVLDGCGEYDSIQMMRQYAQDKGIHLDWHEFSNALDHLHTRRFVDVAGIGRDGQTIYKRR
jgi:hypothetical protein